MPAVIGLGCHLITITSLCAVDQYILRSKMLLGAVDPIKYKHECF